MPTFLIDMDGTLVDSTAVVERAWREMAARHGLDADEIIAFRHGRPTGATTSHFLPDAAVAEAEERHIDEFEEHTVEGIVEIPGAAAFLAQLPAEDWALVTSAGATLATKRMVAADLELPRTCVFADDIGHGKPHPEPYLLAAERMGRGTSECIVLEDSDAGVESALAAGCGVIVVGQLTRFDDALPRVPDLRDATPASLSALVRR